MIKKAAAAADPVSQLREILAEAGVSGKPAAAVVAAAAPRFVDVRRALAEAAVGTGAARLVSFDWNVRVAISSSKLGSFRTPLTHVLLTVGAPRCPPSPAPPSRAVKLANDQP